MANKDNVKPWFQTGKRPDQSQFFAFFDWIWFKDERIPADNIEGLQDLLDEKADKETFEDQAMFVQVGKRTIYKHPTNSNPKMKYTQEENDFVIGFIGENWIMGYYVSGDMSQAENYVITVMS
jgi:hypothetical protein